MFFHCGWLAPETDWWNVFAPLWDMRVLKGPPRIPYFHMTQMKSKHWCKEHGIDRAEAEFRIDEAFGVIDAIPSLVPLNCEFKAGDLLDIFKQKVNFKSGARQRFEPDFLGFIGYADEVLGYLEANHPEATKVDFVVEAKGKTTNRMMEFFAGMPASYAEMGLQRRAELIGAFIPIVKRDDVPDSLRDHRPPTQVADLLNWYTRRSYEKSLDNKEARRYRKIAARPAPGRFPLSKGNMESLYARVTGRVSEKSEE
jgi:hypothetical protein